MDPLFRHDFFDFWIPDDSRYFWHFLSIRFSHLLGLRVYVEQWRWSKTATDDHPWKSNAKPAVCRFHGKVSAKRDRRILYKSSIKMDLHVESCRDFRFLAIFWIFYSRYVRWLLDIWVWLEIESPNPRILCFIMDQHLPFSGLISGSTPGCLQPEGRQPGRLCWFILSRGTWSFIQSRKHFSIFFWVANCYRYIVIHDICIYIYISVLIINPRISKLWSGRRRRFGEVTYSMTSPSLPAGCIPHKAIEFLSIVICGM